MITNSLWPKGFVLTGHNRPWWGIGDALFSSTKKETSYELFIQEANEGLRNRWSFCGRLLLLPGRRDSEDFGASRSCCDLLLVIIPQQRFVHCMVSLISLFFISMLLWCGVFSDCVSSQSPIWWLGFHWPKFRISLVACCFCCDELESSS